MLTLLLSVMLMLVQVKVVQSVANWRDDISLDIKQAILQSVKHLLTSSRRSQRDLHHLYLRSRVTARTAESDLKISRL